MTKSIPEIRELQESFDRIYDGPDELKREYDVVLEASRLGMDLDAYRLLYNLRKEEPIDPYPRSEKWRKIPKDWTIWLAGMPLSKKIFLIRKGAIKLIQSGVIITIFFAFARYLWEIPERQKLEHYQAWEIINSAQGLSISGGRVDALQDWQ